MTISQEHYARAEKHLNAAARILNRIEIESIEVAHANATLALAYAMLIPFTYLDGDYQPDLTNPFDPR